MKYSDYCCYYYYISVFCTKVRQLHLRSVGLLRMWCHPALLPHYWKTAWWTSGPLGRLMTISLNQDDACWPVVISLKYDLYVLISFFYPIVLPHHRLWSAVGMMQSVSLSIRLSMMLCIVAKWYILQQKCLNNRIESAYRYKILQLSAPLYCPYPIHSHLLPPKCRNFTSLVYLPFLITWPLCLHCYGGFCYPIGAKQQCVGVSE